MLKMNVGALILAMGLIGCGSQASQTSTPDPVIDWTGLAQIVVSPNLTSVQVGQAVNFACEGVLTNGTSTSVVVEWVSSNPAIATIDSNGHANGIAAGTVGISAHTTNGPLVIGTSTLEVTPLPVPPPVFVTTQLADGAVGAAYNQLITYSNGSGSPTFSVISGSLPPGLSLNALTGAITGTPDQISAGIMYYFTVQLSDDIATISQPFQIWIDDAIIVNPPGGGGGGGGPIRFPA